MNCPNCGTDLTDNIEECPICGYQIEEITESAFTTPLTCQVCGSVVEEEDINCPICGSPIEHISYQNTNIEQSEDEASPIAEDELPVKQTKNIKKGLIVLTIILLIAVSAILFLTLSQKNKPKENENTTSETTGKKEKKQTSKKSEEEQTNHIQDEENVSESSINIKDYIGYWNISQSKEKELTIHNITEGTVTFSLCYIRIDSIENAAASLKNNSAEFSVDVQGQRVQGNLLFEDESITVQITNSERTYIPVEMMVFNERHQQSWQYGDYTSDPVESYDSYTDNYTFEQPSSYNSDYILENSSTQVLTYDDIKYLSSEQLMLARNEIYARHGRKFNDSTIRSYFESKWWYTGIIDGDNFSESMLSDIEKQNIEFIKSYE